MIGIKRRLEGLEQTLSGSARLTIFLSWAGTDDEGKEISEPISVSGYGWSVQRDEGESAAAFRQRAEAVAADNGKPRLWAAPFIETTIGGEHEC